MSSATRETARASSLRQATYTGFLYGVGEPPIDLGRPRKYLKRDDHVFQQIFERGLTVANTGDVPVEVPLEGCFVGADGEVRAVVNLPPKSAEVLQRV